jgi:hypothetical protein
MAFLIRLSVLLLLTGCTSGRWLSKDEDAAMRAACEPKGGCVVVPRPDWQRIEDTLKRLGLWTEV